MTGIASQAQLRQSFARYALFTVPGVLLLGTLSGALSGSGSNNPWYAALDKPDFIPPGWVFATVWPLLYVMLGLSLAMLLHAKGARGRERLLSIFVLQLALNFAWSPIFFAWHDVGLALTVIAAMLVVTTVMIPLAWVIRRSAALLLVPYLAWLVFATSLNFQIMVMNPDASSLAPAGGGTDIQL